MLVRGVRLSLAGFKRVNHFGVNILPTWTLVHNQRGKIFNVSDWLCRLLGLNKLSLADGFQECVSLCVHSCSLVCQSVAICLWLQVLIQLCNSLQGVVSLNFAKVPPAKGISRGVKVF